MASALIPEADRQVLLALLRTDAAVSGRALARMTGLSQPTAQRALVRLREQGLLMAESAPPALLYRANQDHLAMPALVDLLNLNERLRERAAEEVARWKVPPVSLVLYGSTARGAPGPGSDVDVLVVRADDLEPDDPTWARQVSALSEALFRWTGRRASVVELSAGEVVRGLRGRESFIVAAADEGIVISGESLRALRAASKR